MKRTGEIFAVLLMWILPFTMNAQSMDYIQSMYEQGKYAEVARLLRPKADGGNADAQYLAAKMFFAGQGVDKNTTQALKYAGLAADQGHEDAIVLIASYYYGAQNYQEVYNTVKKYTDRHPYLIKEQPGAILGCLLMEGNGVAKDEERAWYILKDTKQYESAQKDYPQQFAEFIKRHPEEDVTVFDVVEQQPVFPGGMAAISQYLSENIEKPNSGKGKVYITFIVEKNGAVSGAKVLRGINDALDKECLRVVNNMPRWTPGKHNGKPVRVKYTIPISFN